MTINFNDVLENQKGHESLIDVEAIADAIAPKSGPYGTRHNVARGIKKVFSNDNVNLHFFTTSIVNESGHWQYNAIGRDATERRTLREFFLKANDVLLVPKENKSLEEDHHDWT